MKFWSVPREWHGAVCYIVAGGPSVAAQDLTKLKGHKVIVINSSFHAVPFADILFFGDSRWWRENEKQALAFQGRIVTVNHSAEHARFLRCLKVKPPPGLSEKPNELVMRRTSLQAAINLAVHLGAGRLVLLGADMQADGRRTHHHAPHIWQQRPGCWDEQMEELRLTNKPLKRLGIEVFNASPSSRIDWWPKKPLEECLAWPKSM